MVEQYSGGAVLLLVVDDSHIGLRRSWSSLLCEGGVDVLVLVVFSDASSSSLQSLSCLSNACASFSSYRAGRAFWRRPSCLSSGGAFKAKSSIFHFYCCLDSWTVLRASIIVLAIVESPCNVFALSSDMFSSRVFLDFPGYGPCPND